MTAFDMAASVPWAILEPALRTILDIADRAPVSADLVAAWKGEGQPSALSAQPGPRLEGTESVQMRGRTAVVPVRGPIFRYANLFTSFSGASSLGLLARDFAVAVADPMVKAILLEIDSPGGEATAIGEFAEQVRAAVQAKPVTAYVGGVGASAAFWIAAAAGEIVVSPTALLGSIGVVSAYRDDRARQEKAGVRTIEIVSSQSPMKRADPTTDEGRAAVQALVDRLAEEFIGAVARFRGVSPEKVQADFGKGGLLVGRDAVAAGMADRLGSFEEVVGSLSAGSSATVKTSLIAAAEETVVMTEQTTAAPPPPLTAETLAKSHPDIADHFRAEGATAERARILGIESQALRGHEDLVAKLKADGKTTPEQAAVAILAAEKAKGDRILADMMADAPKPVPPSAEPPKSTGENTAPRTEAEAKAAFEASETLQREFKTFSTYYAALKVEAAQKQR